MKAADGKAPQGPEHGTARLKSIVAAQAVWFAYPGPTP